MCWCSSISAASALSATSTYGAHSAKGAVSCSKFLATQFCLVEWSPTRGLRKSEIDGQRTTNPAAIFENRSKFGFAELTAFTGNLRYFSMGGTLIGPFGAHRPHEITEGYPRDQPGKNLRFRACDMGPEGPYTQDPPSTPRPARAEGSAGITAFDRPTTQIYQHPIHFRRVKYQLNNLKQLNFSKNLSRFLQKVRDFTRLSYNCAPYLTQVARQLNKILSIMLFQMYLFRKSAFSGVGYISL